MGVVLVVVSDLVEHYFRKVVNKMPLITKYFFFLTILNELKVSITKVTSRNTISTF